MKPKRESPKGHEHVDTTDKDEANGVQEKQLLASGTNHAPDDCDGEEQHAEAKGGAFETNTDCNVNTETANNANGEADARERTIAVDTNGVQPEHVEPDNDEKLTTDERNVNPSTSATPEQTDLDDFDSRSFLQGVRDLQTRLRSASSRSDTDGHFPADELMRLTQDATTTLNNFKDYSVHSQQQMEGLRHDMEEVGHRIVKQIHARVYVTVDKTSEFAPVAI